MLFSDSTDKDTLKKKTHRKVTVVYRNGLPAHFSTFFHILRPYQYISQTVAANYTAVKRK